MQRFGLRVPPELHLRLKQESEAKDQSINQLILELLGKHYGIKIDVVHRAPKKPRGERK